ESLGGGEVVTEGLFDDHPPPGVLGLAREPGMTELIDDRTEEPVAHRQIEQHISRTALPRVPLRQQLVESTERFRLGEISTHVVHAMDEPRADVLLDRVA